MVSNDMEDDIETNGAGSISGTKKEQHGSSEEDVGDEYLI